MSDDRSKCKADGCKRVLAPFCAEHRDDVVERGAYESLKSNYRGSVSAGLHKDRELAAAREEVARLREALQEAIRAFDQTHINNCIAAYTDRDLHAPDCLQYEADDARAALASTPRGGADKNWAHEHEMDKYRYALSPAAPVSVPTPLRVGSSPGETVTVIASEQWMFDPKTGGFTIPLHKAAPIEERWREMAEGEPTSSSFFAAERPFVAPVEGAKGAQDFGIPCGHCGGTLWETLDNGNVRHVCRASGPGKGET